MITQAVLVALVSAVVAFVLAAAEAALHRMSRVRAEELYDEGRVGSAALRAVMGEPTAYLAVLAFLRVAAEMTTAVLVTLAVAELVPSTGWVLAASIGITLLMAFVVVGVSPRTLGRANYDRVALVAAPLTRGLTRLLGPLASGLVALGRAVTPGEGYAGAFRTESELRDLLEQASHTDVLEDEEAEMLDSVFELGDTLAREVMVPRPDMETVPATLSLRGALTRFVRTGHSRLPVVGEDSDDVRGLLHFKDVVQRVVADPSLLDGDQSHGARVRVTDVMRPMTFVPDSKPIDDLLREMQRDHSHFALVVDEYGGTAGLVTIEDILEEIVGEIADEHDRAEPGVQELGPGVYRVPAGMHIDDVGELFDLEIDEDEVVSVGGLLIKALGRIPFAGARVQVAGLEIEAERMAHRHRIASVLVRRSADEGDKGRDDD